MEDDRDIVRRVVQGDYNAFEVLVDKYEGRIYRHIRKMVNDQNQAEDLLQETFLNAYKGLKGFEGNSSFATWLFRIATNTTLMYLRKQRPEVVEYDDDMKTPAEFDAYPVSREFVSSPLELLLSGEVRDKLDRAIAKLPILYRSVLVLRDVEGFSLEEVSRITDASVPAVKSRLHRARNSVRAELVSYYSDRDRAPGKRASG